MGFVLLAVTIVLTVGGQLLFKWQVDSLPDFPPDWLGRVWMLAKFILRPWVVVALAMAFSASIAWIGVLGQFELSYAYPFTSLSFVFVLILSAVIFQEAITPPKVIGILLIALGVIVSSR